MSRRMYMSLVKHFVAYAYESCRRYESCRKYEWDYERPKAYCYDPFTPAIGRRGGAAAQSVSLRASQGVLLRLCCGTSSSTNGRGEWITSVPRRIVTYLRVMSHMRMRGGGLGSRPIFKKFHETYAPS